MYKRLKHYFLEPFQDKDIVIKQKAKILLLIALFTLFIMEPALFLFLIFLDPGTALFYPLILSLAMITPLILLRKGHYNFAVQLLLFSHMAIVWYHAFTRASMDLPLEIKIYSIIFSFALLVAIPLLIIKHPCVIIGYTAASLLLLSLYLYRIQIYNKLSSHTTITVWVNFFMVFIFIGLISLLIFNSNKRILGRFLIAEEEIQAQNEELAASNEEFEAMNEELVKRQVDIINSETRYRNLYENALTGMITIQEPEGTVIKMNQTGCKLLGVKNEDIEARRHTMDEFYVNNEERSELVKMVMQDGEIYDYEAEFRTKGQKTFWAELSAKLYPEKNQVEAIFTDITKRKNAEENLHRLTYYDPLTDMPNKNMFYSRLLTETLKSQRKNKDNIFAVICLGIDRFKNINDMHGTVTGDRVIKNISHKLNKSIRDDDFAARLEGDKFMILFSDIGKTADIMDIVKKTSEVFNEPIKIDKIDLSITASMGVCIYPNDGDDADTIMKNSETAMFTAKDKGKDTYHLYDADLNAELIDNLKLEKELQDAIDFNEFVVYYQPKVEHSGKIVGTEALIRWNSPQRDQVSPCKFIPLAEKNGMIIDIGKIILHKSCHQVKKWQEMGLPKLKVAVNISPAQFRQPDLIETIQQVLDKTGLAPEYLELELTESGIMDDEHDSIEKLKQIHDLGVSVSIDDFGTGYSSLSKLKDYPIDTLKIDKSFIDHLPYDEKSATIARTIIDLAHNLGFDVVAEGIETEEQLKFLEDNNCDLYQGYYFSKPLLPENFEKELIK